MVIDHDALFLFFFPSWFYIDTLYRISSIAWHSSVWSISLVDSRYMNISKLYFYILVFTLFHYVINHGF